MPVCRSLLVPQALTAGHLPASTFNWRGTGTAATTSKLEILKFKSDPGAATALAFTGNLKFCQWRLPLAFTGNLKFCQWRLPLALALALV